MGKSALMAKKRGPVPKPDERRESSLAVRCKSDYKDWVIKFARENRMKPGDLIDKALVELAIKYGFKPPPER